MTFENSTRPDALPFVHESGEMILLHQIIERLDGAYIVEESASKVEVVEPDRVNFTQEQLSKVGCIAVLDRETDDPAVQPKVIQARKAIRTAGSLPEDEVDEDEIRVSTYIILT